MIKKETYTAVLTNSPVNSGTLTESNFNLNFPNKRASGYDKVTLYVDNYTLNSTPLTTPFLNLSGSFYQKNSVDSVTSSNTRLLAIVPNQLDRNTSNNVISISNNVNYQGNTTPIAIEGMPDSITLFVSTLNNSVVNLDTNSNAYFVRLRFECEYTEY